MTHIKDRQKLFEDKQIAVLALLAEITMIIAKPVKSPCWGMVGDMNRTLAMLADIKQSIEDEE